MIEIGKIKDCKGALKYGTCASCDKNSKDDANMIRITFKQFSSGSTVCLCEKCFSDTLTRMMAYIS